MPSGAFTANTQDSVNNGANKGRCFGNCLDVIVWGTFTMTLQIQFKAADGTWVQYGANITAPGGQVVNSADPGREWRLASTAFTSGTANWEITGVRDESKVAA